MSVPGPPPVGGPAAGPTVPAAGPQHRAGAQARSVDHAADEWLIREAVSGSAFSGQAFEVLLRRHQDRIYRIALRITGDPGDAADVTQDVAVQLWRVLVTFTGSSTFSTWLYRIVVNRSLDLQRARRVPGRSTGELHDEDHPSTAGPAQRVEDAAHLEAATHALARLPAEQRVAVVLCQIEGLTYREAAVAVNISEAALRSRLERGRRNLLAAMKDWT